MSSDLLWAVERRGVKSKGEKERYKHLNAEFQRIARRDKKAFLSDQCKEIEENNRIGKTRDGGAWWTAIYGVAQSWTRLKRLSSSSCSIVPCLVLTVGSWPACRFLRRKVRWSGIPISLRISHSLLWSIKDFSRVNKAEVDVFLEPPCIFYDPADVGNLISGSSAFSKTSLNIWKFRFTYCWSLPWRIYRIDWFDLLATMWNEHSYAGGFFTV